MLSMAYMLLFLKVYLLCKNIKLYYLFRSIFNQFWRVIVKEKYILLPIYNSDDIIFDIIFEKGGL